MQLQSWFLNICGIHLGRVSRLLVVPYGLVPSYIVGAIYTVLIDRRRLVQQFLYSLNS